MGEIRLNPDIRDGDRIDYMGRKRGHANRMGKSVDSISYCRRSKSSTEVGGFAERAHSAHRAALTLKPLKLIDMSPKNVTKSENFAEIGFLACTEIDLFSIILRFVIITFVISSAYSTPQTILT